MLGFTGASWAVLVLSWETRPCWSINLAHTSLSDALQQIPNSDAREEGRVTTMRKDEEAGEQ